MSCCFYAIVVFCDWNFRCVWPSLILLESFFNKFLDQINLCFSNFETKEYEEILKVSRHISRKCSEICDEISP